MLTVEALQQKLDSEGSPDILAIQQDDKTIELSLFVPENLSWFKGHYPEQPVLPGVVQVDWAGKFSQLLFEQLNNFRGINNLKYKSMVLPNTKLELVLEYKEDKQQVKFTYKNVDDTFSSAILQF